MTLGKPAQGPGWAAVLAPRWPGSRRMRIREKSRGSYHKSPVRVPGSYRNQNLLEDPHGPLTAEGVGEVMQSFKKALIERVLGGELSQHLGYSPGEENPSESTNHRNGTSGKT